MFFHEGTSLCICLWLQKTVGPSESTSCWWGLLLPAAVLLQAYSSVLQIAIIWTLILYKHYASMLLVIITLVILYYSNL